MKKPLRIATLFALFALAGCSQTPAPPYADAYTNALGRYQGTTQISPEMLDRFVYFFSHGQTDPADAASGESAPQSLDPDDLYGDAIYFSDTLLTTENRELALNHLRRMSEGTASLHVDVIDRQVEGQDAYLIWQMRARFTPVRSEVLSNSIGVTHLRFDDGGRIILHQDFWDSAAGFYEHLPVLGFFIDSIKGMFNEDDR